MKKNHTHNTACGGKNGAALVVVLCLAGIMLIASFSLVMVSGSMARKSSRIYKGVQALAIAEAGVADVLERMETNYIALVDTVHTQSFAGGDYVVKTKSDMATGNVTIWSDGRIDDEDRMTVVELLGDIASLYGKFLGAGDAILAERDVTLDTAALQINGSVHANQNVLHTRGNTKVNGDVSACGVVEVNVTPGHTKTPGAGRIVIPDFQPFDAWKDLAQLGGIYYPSSVVLKGVTLTPGNGVVYVDGDIEIAKKPSVLLGTLVAAGTITINNRFDQTAFNTNWPALLAGMNVELLNRNTYQGVIFAGNNIRIRNNRDITGALVSLNNITMDNRGVVNPLTQSPSFTPEDTNSVPEVIVGGWLR